MEFPPKNWLKVILGKSSNLGQIVLLTVNFLLLLMQEVAYLLLILLNNGIAVILVACIFLIELLRNDYFEAAKVSRLIKSFDK